jgi:hypothetical protein
VRLSSLPLSKLIHSVCFAPGSIRVCRHHLGRPRRPPGPEEICVADALQAGLAFTYRGLAIAATGAQSRRMRSIEFLGMAAALLLSCTIARAEPLSAVPQVGDTYEITLIKDSVQQGGNKSSGSSHDQATIIERVIGLRADGVELQYDLPNTTTADERARSWQFPARIFKPSAGPGQVLNGPELETRVNAWLEAAGLPRTACGQWYFTWNAFRIECDPESVLKTVQAFDLRSADVREGAAYQESDAHGSGTLARKAGRPESATFTVEMPVDPEAFRRARAESDVVVGQILKKPVSLEAALSQRATEIISGTISIAFETDSVGTVLRRTKVTKLDIKGPNGLSETQTVTETLERRLISKHD